MWRTSAQLTDVWVCCFFRHGVQLLRIWISEYFLLFSFPFHMTTPIPSPGVWTVDPAWVWVWLIFEMSGKTFSLLKLPRCNNGTGNHPHPMTQHLMRINGSDGKESACKAGGPGLIPGSGRSPGEGNGCLLQYSYLENSMDGGAWRATVHRVTKSRTPLSDQHTQMHTKWRDDSFLSTCSSKYIR